MEFNVGLAYAGIAAVTAVGFGIYLAAMAVDRWIDAPRRHRSPAKR